MLQYLFGSTDVDENSFGLNSGTSRNGTHENADAFPKTPSGINIKAEKVSAVAKESSIPNNEETSHFENTTTHRPKKWGFFVTKSGQTRKRDILEICVHVVMAVAAIMVLELNGLSVFAILAARVDSTYPSTSIKYTTEGPFTQISPCEPVLFYPDASTEDVG
ncbi:hypothetical protein HYALB_00004127 [Hymenoscyphus albidus]|uniref:Uncharacterized protein n=1 Tax=Hymenoscyphus albidus TaxID=595503 RepID=A0A9N9Q5I6_9HELO|nr:hypothetical protein HYALB_00004127 [Hymenoscyphus albidus]